MKDTQRQTGNRLRPLRDVGCRLKMNGDSDENGPPSEEEKQADEHNCSSTSQTQGDSSEHDHCPFTQSKMIHKYNDVFSGLGNIDE